MKELIKSVSSQIKDTSRPSKVFTVHRSLPTASKISPSARIISFSSVCPNVLAVDKLLRLQKNPDKREVYYIVEIPIKRVTDT